MTRCPDPVFAQGMPAVARIGHPIAKICGDSDEQLGRGCLPGDCAPAGANQAVGWADRRWSWQAVGAPPLRLPLERRTSRGRQAIRWPPATLDRFRHAECNERQRVCIIATLARGLVARAAGEAHRGWQTACVEPPVGSLAGVRTASRSPTIDVASRPGAGPVVLHPVLGEPAVICRDVVDNDGR